MITASNGMIAYIGGNARTFVAQFLVDGAVLPCDILSITVNKGAGEDFVPGALFIPYIEAKIANCSEVLEGKDITLQIGATINGSVEWLTMGKFTVATANKSLGGIEVTAVGFLNSKCSEQIQVGSGSSYSSVLGTITARTGLSISYKGITVTGAFSGLMTGTIRDIISYIATDLGGFVTEDNNGGIVIAKHMSGTQLTVTDERCVTPPTYKDADDTSEGYTFRQASIDMVLGDPRLEPWDYLNADGHTVPCLRVSHTFTGGLQTAIDSTVYGLGVTEVLKGSVERAIEDLRAQLEEQYVLELHADYVSSVQTIVSVVLLCGEEDVHTRFPATLFEWSRKTEDAITYLGTGYSITVDNTQMGYGGMIVCKFFRDESVPLLLPDGNHLIFPDSKRLCMTILGG